MPNRTASYDVLIATDCRFPGGSSSSVVEEIQAQHRAGYTTGLLHLPSTVLTHPRPFNPKIRKLLERGEAELVLGVDHVETRLLLARHPSVFTSPPDDLPQVRAEEVVLAVNQVPTDDRGERPYYDVVGVDRQIQRMYGKPAIWSPIGPRVRDALLPYAAQVRLSEEDWENIIDVEAWEVDRPGFVGDRPVIGRHSRGHWTKWPDNREDLLAAYPDDPRYLIRVLGGVATPRKMLGGLPANWVDHPFNSLPAQEYLRTIDFLVYFHHPGLIEAFGRVVLEGMAAGTVAIVPHYLERLFGDVCVYAEPAEVRDHIDAIYGDWAAYQERSIRGVDLARRRFSYDTHIRRVTELVGGPSDPTKGSGTTTPSARAASHRPVSMIIDLTRPTQGTSPVVEVTKAMDSAGSRGVAAVAPARLDLVPESWIVEALPTVLEQLTTEDRGRYLKHRAMALFRDHRPTTVVVIDDGGGATRPIVRSAEDDGRDVLVVRRGTGPREGEDRDTAKLLAASLPEAWSVQPITQLATPEAPAAEATQYTGLAAIKWVYWRADRQMRRTRRFVLNRARKSKRFARPALFAVRGARQRTLITAARSSGLTLVPLPSTSYTLPARGWLTHPDPSRLPLVLVVDLDPDADPESLILSVVERQQVTSGFRVALLGPANWVESADRYGLTLETLVLEEDWRDLHGGGWETYLERRVQDVRAAVGATSVMLLDANNIDTCLALLEASGAPPPSK